VDSADEPRWASVLARCAFPPAGTAVDCAVSGGPDSLALLVLAVASGCTVTAWHVDHGLRAGSADEATVVSSAAARLGAGFRSVTVALAPGPNLEDRARQARYGVLPGGVLTGHTADDQAETVLLALLRGAGLDGLAGMRPDGRRPLLALRRAETVALCAAEGLVPVDDPSNSDPAFRRNRVRHELVPLACAIAERDVVPVLARTAALLRVEADALDGLAAPLDPTDVAGLLAAPPALARRALRRWLASFSGGHPPDAAALGRVLDVVSGRRRACQVAGVGTIARSRGWLRVDPAGGVSGVSGEAPGPVS
jgi:tRNA(Ile)-lysidine synthase